MAVTIKISSVTPPDLPTNGWIVEYAKKGSGQFTTAPGSPFMVAPSTNNPWTWDTTDAEGTLYDIRVTRDCGTLDSTAKVFTTPCNCAPNYQKTAAGDKCVDTVTTSPLTAVNACFAPNHNGSYSGQGMRVYKPGFSSYTLFVNWMAADTYIVADTRNGNSYSATFNQWKGKADGNPGTSPFLGPMNREGIWLDSDQNDPGSTVNKACDGVPDIQKQGSAATASLAYYSSSARIMYVGVAADNDFNFKLNGNVIVNTQVGNTRWNICNQPTSNAPYCQYQFSIWHILPVNIPQGNCLFNLEVTNAAGTSQNPATIAMVLYGNTNPQDFYQASCNDPNATGTGIYDIGLTVIGHTKQLISPLGGPGVSIITCPDGYAVTTDGTQCITALYMDCNTTSDITVDFVTTPDTLPCSSNTAGVNKVTMTVNGAPAGALDIVCHLTMGGYMQWPPPGANKDAIYIADMSIVSGATITGSPTMQGTVPYNTTQSLSPPPGPSVTIHIASGNSAVLAINSHVDYAGSHFFGTLIIDTVNGTKPTSAGYAFCVGYGS